MTRSHLSLTPTWWFIAIALGVAPQFAIAAVTNPRATTVPNSGQLSAWIDLRDTVTNQLRIDIGPPVLTIFAQLLVNLDQGEIRYGIPAAGPGSELRARPAFFETAQPGSVSYTIVTFDQLFVPNGASPSAGLFGPALSLDPNLRGPERISPDRLSVAWATGLGQLAPIKTDVLISQVTLTDNAEGAFHLWFDADLTQVNEPLIFSGVVEDGVMRIIPESAAALLLIAGAATLRRRR